MLLSLTSSIFLSVASCLLFRDVMYALLVIVIYLCYENFRVFLNSKLNARYKRKVCESL